MKRIEEHEDAAAARSDDRTSCPARRREGVPFHLAGRTPTTNRQSATAARRLEDVPFHLAAPHTAARLTRRQPRRLDDRQPATGRQPRRLEDWQPATGRQPRTLAAAALARRTPCRLDAASFTRRAPRLVTGRAPRTH